MATAFVGDVNKLYTAIFPPCCGYQPTLGGDSGGGMPLNEERVETGVLSVGCVWSPRFLLLAFVVCRRGCFSKHSAPPIKLFPVRTAASELALPWCPLTMHDWTPTT